LRDPLAGWFQWISAASTAQVELTSGREKTLETHHLQREVAGHARELRVGPVQDDAGDVERVLVAQRVLSLGTDG